MRPTRIGSLSVHGLTSSARPGETFQREKVYVKQTGNPSMWCIAPSCIIPPEFSHQTQLYGGINFATLMAAFRGHISSFCSWGSLISHWLRYVYVPNEENSSKSLEMERIMREARFGKFWQHHCNQCIDLSIERTVDESFPRMRELCKGLYSSSYEDSINSRVRCTIFHKFVTFFLAYFGEIFGREESARPSSAKWNKQQCGHCYSRYPRGSDNSKDSVFPLERLC